jgi:hypothetical protein
MPYQVFYVERAANEPSLERPRKEHYRTKDKALGRIRSLFKDNRTIRFCSLTGPNTS